VREAGGGADKIFGYLPLGGAFRNQKISVWLRSSQFGSDNLKKAQFVSQWFSSGSKKHGISQSGTVSLSMSQKVMAKISRKGTIMGP
jgi:hypothetical protein